MGGLDSEDQTRRLRCFSNFEKRVLVIDTVDLVIDAVVPSTISEHVDAILNYDLPVDYNTYALRLAVLAPRVSAGCLAMSFVASEMDAAVLDSIQSHSKFPVEMTDGF